MMENKMEMENTDFVSYDDTTAGWLGYKHIETGVIDFISTDLKVHRWRADSDKIEIIEQR
jgi:hypothetical protein